MRRDIADWLAGQIDAINALSKQVESVVRVHCLVAAEDLQRIRYACNSAREEIRRATEAGGES